MWDNLHDGYQDLSFTLKSESIADWSDILSSALLLQQEVKVVANEAILVVCSLWTTSMA